MKSYLSASVQIYLGLGNPHIATMPQMEDRVQGVEKRTAGWTVRSRRPIMPQNLVLMKQMWEVEPDRFDATRLWAAACMCFLHSREVVVPSLLDYVCRGCLGG